MMNTGITNDAMTVTRNCFGFLIGPVCASSWVSLMGSSVSAFIELKLSNDYIDGTFKGDRAKFRVDVGRRIGLR